MFAFDPEFLRRRAPPVVLLWLLALANMGLVCRQGRWSPLTRRLDLAVNLGFVALLGWWLAGGAMFQAAPTDAGARGGIALVVLCIVIDLALKLYRRRTRIHPPEMAL